MTRYSGILADSFVSGSTAGERLRRFITALTDGQFDSAECVILAAILLGTTCGLLGCFVVLRRQSLLGDAIGHSILPGVCAGFLISSTRSTPVLLAGALVAGLLASALITILQRTTRLKSGECMGIVFTGFYGIGIVLVKYIQNRGLSGHSGLERFLFGQIAAISTSDVIAMAVISGLTIVLVLMFWRALSISSFDEGFAISVGIRAGAVHVLLNALLTCAIIVAVQAVGVVLVSAMLIAPAATAYLLTDRLHRMAIFSAIIGATTATGGAILSLLGESLPTGATMVLTGATLFAIAYALAPTHGVIPRWWRVWSRRQRTAAENLLRTLYIMMERRSSADRRFGVHEIAAVRQETPAMVHRLWRVAARHGWVRSDTPDPIMLTDDGFIESRRIVRNHRLWELFLTQQAHLDADHVHADAEYIEHVLPKDVLLKLERMLDHPTADPHGKPIPQS